MSETGKDIDKDKPPIGKVRRYIPGFKGYQQKEDIRDADRMLRMQLSQKISVLRQNMEWAKASIEEKGLMVDISKIESVLNSLKRMSSEIGYADSGYSWKTSSSNLVEDEVERIYDYDAGLLDQITLLQGMSSRLCAAASDSDVAALDRDSTDIYTHLAFIEDLLIKRMAAMNRT